MRVNKQCFSFSTTTTVISEHPHPLRHHGHQRPPPLRTIVRLPTTAMAHTDNTSRDKNDAVTPCYQPQQPGEHHLAQRVAVTTWHVNGTFRMCHKVCR
jgi:hypothetical protein